jgi:hypothetical protein
MERLLAAFVFACVAFWIARALGIPVWRNWEPGDATDIALFTGWGVLLLISAVRA